MACVTAFAPNLELFLPNHGAFGVKHILIMGIKEKLFSNYLGDEYYQSKGYKKRYSDLIYFFIIIITLLCALFSIYSFTIFSSTLESRALYLQF